MNWREWIRIDHPAFHRSASWLKARLGRRGALVLVFGTAYVLTFLVWYIAFRVADGL